MSQPREIVFDVPSSLWLTSNQRKHWAPRSRATRELRTLALIITRRHHVPRLGRTTVTAHIGYPPGVGRADPGNTHPTTKALIDGMVDAGVWPDDDSRHVIDGGHRRGPSSGKRGIYRVRLTLEPASGEGDE